MPNSSEKIVQNLPCTKYAMNQLANQLRPVRPRGMPSSRLAMVRLKNSMFIKKMPSSANPRTTSSASMR